MNFTQPPDPPDEGVSIPNRRTDPQDVFDVKTDVYLNWLSGFRSWTAGLAGWLKTFLAELVQALQTVEANKNAAQAAAAASATSRPLKYLSTPHLQSRKMRPSIDER